MDRSQGRAALIASAVLFALYFVNVVVGKVSLLMGATQPLHAGDVTEFLVLLAAVICFIVAALQRENAE